MSYGIYTVADENFFAGAVAAINGLRSYGCRAPVAVIDLGLRPWMRQYLLDFAGVQVVDLSSLRGLVRYTDVRSDEDPLLHGWAFKAFGIAHHALFDELTYIDADYLPLCNLQAELLPLIRAGAFVSSDDGHNTWDERHAAATGVAPGTYLNINAGFLSFDATRYGYVLHEWRNLMTRRAPFDLWYGDQGALNVVLDKYGVHKTALDRQLWNQTWLNEEMSREGAIVRVGTRLIQAASGRRIYGWHGCGWYKLWHQIGIDHYRRDEREREAFYQESQGKSPAPVVELFTELLFCDRFNRPLNRAGWTLAPPRRTVRRRRRNTARSGG